MTREEFDVWIEQHYGELLTVATRRTNSEDHAADAVGRAVVNALVSGWFKKSEKPWTRMALEIRGYCRDIRELVENRRVFTKQFKNDPTSTPSLGCKRTKPAPNAE